MKEKLSTQFSNFSNGDETKSHIVHYVLMGKNSCQHLKNVLGATVLKYAGKTYCSYTNIAGILKLQTTGTLTVHAHSCIMAIKLVSLSIFVKKK